MPFLSLPYGNIPDGSSHFRQGLFGTDYLKDKKGNDTIPFFRSGQGNCGPSFYAEIVVKKLPQLGYLTDIFLIGVR